MWCCLLFNTFYQWVSRRSRSGWVTFSAVVLLIAGPMRVIDAVWAFRYSGKPVIEVNHAALGHGLPTYWWIWLITGVVLLFVGILDLGPASQPSAEVARWIGIRWSLRRSRR
jgi:hypothetical protein